MENGDLFDENGHALKENCLVDRKEPLSSNFNYLYFDYLLSKPICLQVFFFWGF